MLRSGNQLRLTRPERARLARITAIEPGSIRSVADLQAYVRRCKAHYWGHSDDTRFQHQAGMSPTSPVSGSEGGSERAPEPRVDGPAPAVQISRR